MAEIEIEDEEPEERWVCPHCWDKAVTALAEIHALAERQLKFTSSDRDLWEEVLELSACEVTVRVLAEH